MPDQPMISVIVPCYNYGHFLPETLRSLQQQSMDNWECIIVDDGSKDNSAEVAAQFTAQDARIKYIYQENQGLPSARNAGIERAQGRYLHFLDSDDLLQTHKYKAAVDYLEHHPDSDVVVSGLQYFIDGTQQFTRGTGLFKNQKWYLQRSGKGMDLLPYMIISSVLMPPMPVFRRESLLNKVGLFSKELKSCEDWEFWLRCMTANLQFKYLELPQTDSLMRLHANSMTRKRSTMVEAILEVRNRIDQMVSDPKLKQLNQRFRINDLVELGLIDPDNASAKLAALAKTHDSLRLRLFSFTVKILPNQLNYNLLALLKSIMKRLAYMQL